MLSNQDIQIKSEQNNVLLNKRILVCGKGGSGKSTLTTLITEELMRTDNKILLLDGDASNPGGLVRMIFGNVQGPEPLIDFFGGRDKIECPADDPSLLTRKNDDIPITENPLKIEEIPEKYYLAKDNMLLLQTGKINVPYEGCDGPMSKIVRDFIVEDNAVTLIDVEAGIEHYGRGIESNVDIVFICVDPTYESILIANKVNHMCKMMNIENVWVVLNKIEDIESEKYIRTELIKQDVKVLGTVNFEKDLQSNAMKGSPLINSRAQKDIREIIKRLKMSFSQV